MKLSIITINYNNAEGLKKTLASVAAQTYANIEHIIVDGNSTDGSVEIIEAYASDVARRASGCVPQGGEGSCAAVEGQDSTPANGAQPLATQDATSPKATQPHKVTWISEKDTGIYNAMNKGIRMATGEYIQILNSGDILFDANVTQRMIERLDQINSQREENVGILYGNMIKVNAAGKVVGKSGYTEYSLRQFYSSTLNHDCAYIRRDLFKEYGLYDEQLKIVSDWKWYLQAIGLGKVKPEYVDIDVTIFDDGGISETNLALRNAERRKVLEEVMPPAVLWDYDTHAFEMEQMKRLRRWKLYPLVYFMERVCFKFEKWGIK
jgi:glycosyltransferase involved in cell wall biosynthesis